MDPDALRMLADLGLARRDIVSAPDEIPKSGRRERQDPREQAQVAAEFEARRHRTVPDKSNGGDERAARLKAWNSMYLMMYICSFTRLTARSGGNIRNR